MTTLLHLAIRKELKAFTLQVELRLDSQQGQILVLFGPSGSGKTMTLRCLAGITNPDAGFILLGERTLFDSRARLNIKTAQRQIGYLPQNYALFPHLTVNQNVAFGLFKWDKQLAQRRIAELLDVMQLAGLEKRYPRELSGGQQQRVALARALAPQPSILLLDEPFAALDSNIRADLRQNLALLARELGLPIVFITHDLEEAYMLADRIAIYNQGHVLQYDTREEIFYRPTTIEAARLVGIKNLWEGRVLETQPTSSLVLVRTIFADLWAQLPINQPLPIFDTKVTLSVRPENVRLLPSTLTNDKAVSNCFTARLRGEVARGSRFTLLFSLNSGTSPDLEVEIPAQDYATLRSAQLEDNKWQLEINPTHLHLIFD